MNRRPLSKKVRDAIALLASGEARHVKQAAQAVGASREAVSRALQREEGQRLLDQGLRAHRSVYSRMRAQRAIDHLAKYGRSEDIRLRASQWIDQTTGVVGGGAGTQGGGGSGVGGGTFVLNLVLKGDVAAQNGAVSVQSAGLIEQRVRTIEVSATDRDLAKDAVGPGRGLGTPGGQDG